MKNGYNWQGVCYGCEPNYTGSVEKMLVAHPLLLKEPDGYSIN